MDMNGKRIESDDFEEHDFSKQNYDIPLAYGNVKLKNQYLSDNVILSVNHLKVFYMTKRWPKKEYVKAVHDINFQIHKGEIFGLVGEEGSGKTIASKAITGNEHITSGAVYFKGKRIAAGDRWNKKEIKWSRIHGKEEIKRLLACKSIQEVENHPSNVNNLYVGKEMKDFSLDNSEYVTSAEFFLYDQLVKGNTFINAKKELENLANSFIDGTYDSSVYFFKTQEEANENGFQLLKRLNNLTEKDLLDSLLPSKDLDQLVLSRINTIKHNIKAIRKEQKEKIKQIHFDNSQSGNGLRLKIQTSLQDKIDDETKVSDFIKNRIRSTLKNSLRADNPETIDKALKEVSLDSSYPMKTFKELSSIEKAKVDIAASLATDSSLLIVDESSISFTESEKDELKSVIKAVRENRMISILILTRDIDFANCVSDTIAIMYKGDMVELADKEELMKKPLHPYTKSFITKTESKNISKPKSDERPVFRRIKKNHYVLSTMNESIAYKTSMMKEEN